MLNALPFCWPNIVFVSLLGPCDLLGALGANAGRLRRVVDNVVSAHASLPCLAKVLQFTTGVHANCMLSAVHGPRWSVSDIWWDLGPTT